MYKKERTYRAREGDGNTASQSVSLPPCLSNAQADQQKDVQAALRRLPPHGLSKIGLLVCHAPNTAQNRLRHRHRVKPPWHTSPASARC
ncbi:hypothetical protein ACU6HM_08810 [Alcaligenes sp. RM2]